MLKVNLLPKEYQEVEYIESNDGSAINTLYFPKSENIKIETKFNINSSGISATIAFGSSNSNDSAFGIQWWANMFYVGATRRIGLYNLSVQNDYETIVETNNGIITLNVENNSYSSSYDGILYKNSSFGLFRCWQEDHWHANYIPHQKIYYLKLYDNNVLVRNFVPCYRKSDNEIGMFDLVNNIFYKNTADGYFSKGNNKQRKIKKIIQNNNSTLKEIKFIKYKKNNKMVDLYIKE